MKANVNLQSAAEEFLESPPPLCLDKILPLSSGISSLDLTVWFLR